MRLTPLLGKEKRIFKNDDACRTIDADPAKEQSKHPGSNYEEN